MVQGFLALSSRVKCLAVEGFRGWGIGCASEFRGVGIAATFLLKQVEGLRTGLPNKTPLGLISWHVQFNL